ncbi:hypothetical protein D3C83_253150 [compost metagenome]
MAVAENSRLAGRVQPVGVDQRVARGLDHLDVFELGLAHRVGDELGGLAHVGLVFGLRGDARDTEELFELV